MADRESFDREREELMLRIDEYEESERLRLDEHDDRDNELRSAKDEHDRLLAIIAIRNNTTNDHEKTIVERDHELDRVRKDYTTLQSKLSSLQLHHDTRLAELEAKN